MAEQRKEAEAQKTKELAKQIQQEREQEELDKISGKKGPKLDRGIDWMYQGGGGQVAKEDAEREAEEFLLGKEYVAEGTTVGDFDNGDQGQGINTVIKSQPVEETATAAGAGSSAFANEPSVKDRNEDFRLRVEDPMFLVTQKQQEKEVKHDKTKALYERVVGYREDAKEKVGDKEKDHKKASKKDKKKRHKKHKKYKSSGKRDRDYDSVSDDHSSNDDEGRRHRHRSHRSDSPGRHRSKRHKRSPSYDHHRRSDEEDSWHESRDKYHRHRDDDRSSSRRHRHHDKDASPPSRGKKSNRRDHSDGEDENSRSRRRHEDDRRRDHDDRESSNRRRSDDRYHEQRREDERSSRKPDRPHHRPSDDVNRRSKTAAASASNLPSQNLQKKEGFGLKGGLVTVDRNNLGPNRELLQKKRDEREAELRRIRETASSRRQRTDQERQRALDEMQANARKRDEVRSRGQDNGRKHDDGEEHLPRRGDASFLKDITRQSHGIGDGSQSLSSRVAQNRHTNQRLHDSFL